MRTIGWVLFHVKLVAQFHSAQWSEGIGGGSDILVADPKVMEFHQTLADNQDHAFPPVEPHSVKP